MIIDKSYFIGEISIAQLGSIPVQDALTLFIDKREPEYLKKALGYAFAKLFSDGLAADVVEQRWTDLLEGAEYDDCEDITREWMGFQNDGKQSPIANYIYYWYQRDNITFTASVGEMAGKAENATSVSPAPKMIRVWNEMVKWNKSLYDYLLNKKDDAGELVYPEFKPEAVECLKRMNYYGL